VCVSNWPLEFFWYSEDIAEQFASVAKWELIGCCKMGIVSCCKIGMRLVITQWK